MKELHSNLKSQSFLLISKILTQIIFPSLMIYYWGKENFNLWIFLFSIPSFFSLFQISVVSPSRNQMSIYYRNKKFKFLNEIYQNSLFFVFFNCSIFSLAILFYIYFNLDNLNVILNIDIIIITLFSGIISLLIGPLSMIFTYKGTYKTFINYEIFFDLILALAIPISFYFLKEFKNTFYLALLIYIIKITFIFIFIKDEHVNKYPNIKYYKLDIIKKIINISTGFNFQIIGNIIKGPGLVFLLGTSNNLSLTGLVSTVRTMFYFFPLRFFDVIAHSFFLEFTKYFKKNKFKKEFISVYIKSLVTVFILLFCVILFTNFFGLFFYKFWLNNEYLINNELILLIILDVFFVILSQFLTMPLKSINNYGYIGLMDLVSNLTIFIIIVQFDLYQDLLLIFKIILFSSIISFIFKFIVNFFIMKKFF